MSDKKRDGKRTARERMREQRERDKVRAKRRRTAAVSGGIVAVLAVAAVVGIVVSDLNHGSQGGPAAAPSGATGKGGLAVPVGAPAAAATLTVYEDFRCPACDGFEKTYRGTIHSLMDSGQLKGEYHLVRLIDTNAGGTGSLNAANAAACAQVAGRFRAYHDVLYDNQPNEETDKFSDSDYLIKLAGKVPGLKSAAFTSCVENGTYDAWVNKSNGDFDSAGFGSTPTVLLNGKNIYADRAHPLTPARLRQLVAAVDKSGPTGSAEPVAGRAEPSGSAGSAVPGGPSGSAGSPAPGGMPTASTGSGAAVERDRPAGTAVPGVR